MTEPPDFPPLERKCNYCDGSGVAYQTRERNPCPYCSGTGHIPTKFGEGVLALVRHNIKEIM